ncbi:MAG: hypothetical protein K8E66_01765, partial [Phycisphaerales bacterium]|nr:hypothetical protein [Phycisphaerales bacterium]
ACMCLAAGALSGIATAGGIGPDVIVGNLDGVSNYGGVGGTRAYAIGTVSCNIGDDVLLWIDGSNQHPVIGQTVYRLLNGRFEQMGQSWLKHGFAALNGSLCDSCNPTGFDTLGVGCSDPYSSGLNGQQSNLGTKTQVNAWTGFYNWPFGGAGQGGNAIFKRVQVAEADLNAGGLWYGGGQYVTPDDAAAGNQNNNSSWRPLSRNGFTLQVTSFTRREQAPVYAWKEADAGVDLQELHVSGEGMFNLAARAYDNGDGTWDYEYALHNQTSHLSADSFSVPAVGVSTSDEGFHDVAYHSGDPYDGTDWPVTEGGNAVTWTAVDMGTNTNALRWGTMYNFRFTANTAPTTGDVEIGMYRSGGPASITATTVVPSAGQAGCNQADIAAEFGVLDLQDVQAFIAGFVGGDLIADMNGDGILDLQDVQQFITAFTAGCP